MAKQDRKAATTETAQPAARTKVRAEKADGSERADAYITDDEFATPVGPAEAGSTGGTDQRV